MAMSSWKAWTDCTKAESARRVATRVAELAGLSSSDLVVAPYSKGGFVVEWLAAHTASTHEAFVVELIRCGQRVAAGWSMTGAVDDDFGAMVSKQGGGRISVPGVTMLTWKILPTIERRQLA